jgi:phage terminase large subunit-like protein
MTEFITRYIAYQAFNRYPGYDIMIIAQREGQAKHNMDRLQSMLRATPDVVLEQNSKQVKHANGTGIWVFPSNSQAFRGPERVKCLFLDEAAYFDTVDDEKIVSAITPNLANTDGDMLIVSTPFGARGFFWRIYYDSETDRLFLELKALEWLHRQITRYS